MGIGNGGTRKLVGRTYTDDECITLVRGTEPHANGASRSPFHGIGNCYAEFEASRSGASWLRTCLFSGQLTLFILQDK